MSRLAFTVGVPNTSLDTGLPSVALSLQTDGQEILRQVDHMLPSASTAWPGPPEACQPAGQVASMTSGGLHR